MKHFWEGVSNRKLKVTSIERFNKEDKLLLYIFY